MQRCHPGRLTMGWVSKYLRKAIVEIDTVSGSEAPLNNGSGIDWQTVYNEVDGKLIRIAAAPMCLRPAATPGLMLKCIPLCLPEEMLQSGQPNGGYILSVKKPGLNVKRYYV